MKAPTWSGLARLRSALSLRGPEPVPDDGLLADATSLYEVERRLRQFNRVPRPAHALALMTQHPADDLPV